MTIDEIIDYVTHSPENTNPNVLKGMLGNIGSGGQELPEGALIFLPAEADETTMALNKTWNEIHEGSYYTKNNTSTYFLTAEEYNSYFIVPAQSLTGTTYIFVANTPDDYPVFTPDFDPTNLS